MSIESTGHARNLNCNEPAFGYSADEQAYIEQLAAAQTAQGVTPPKQHQGGGPLPYAAAGAVGGGVGAGAAHYGFLAKPKFATPSEILEAIADPQNYKLTDKAVEALGKQEYVVGNGEVKKTAQVAIDEAQRGVQANARKMLEGTKLHQELKKIRVRGGQRGTAQSILNQVVEEAPNTRLSSTNLSAYTDAIIREANTEGTRLYDAIRNKSNSRIARLFNIEDGNVTSIVDDAIDLADNRFVSQLDDAQSALKGVIDDVGKHLPKSNRYWALGAGGAALAATGYAATKAFLSGDSKKA